MNDGYGDIGIAHVSAWLPADRIDNRERLTTFGIDEEFLKSRTGMLRIARKRDSEDTSDLCVAALRQLVSETQLNPASVDCLVVCTQNPDACGLPHTSAIVHGKLGLQTHCACFDVSLGCSGYIYALPLMQGFMAAQGCQQGVLITADPYSKIINPNDKNTSLIFGDGASATLFNRQPVWQLGKAVLGTRGDAGAAIRVRTSDRKFEMNGRAVVEFCSRVIPENIQETLDRNQLTMEQIDRVLAHQGSYYIVELISRRMGLSLEKVPFDCSDYGNTVSSSVPMLLAANRDDQTVLLTGFGVGLSWGSIVLHRQTLP